MIEVNFKIFVQKKSDDLNKRFVDCSLQILGKESASHRGYCRMKNNAGYITLSTP